MRQLKVGDSTIDRVTELDAFWVDAQWLYPDIQGDTIRRYAAECGSLFVDVANSKLCLSFHSYVVRARGMTILVDTCNGCHKPRMPWQHALRPDAYLGNLRRLGVEPADIDVVICTHLHSDHVGWNTSLVDGRWVPTFPNARFKFVRQEYQHALAMYERGSGSPIGMASFADSVWPLVEAGRVDLVEMDHIVHGEPGAGVWLEPATGHTPGQVIVHVQEGEARAIISADVVHHPIVLFEPSLVNGGDWNPTMAAETRRRLLERCADTSTWLLSMHFPSPTAGKVVSCAKGFRFEFRED